MQYIDSLLRQLDADTLDDLPAIRAWIVDLIFQSLDCSVSLDAWEKVHFANAIGALALNVNSVQQPTKAWLRLCLADLQKALSPAAIRPKNFTPAAAVLVEELNREQLLTALDSIGRKVSRL